MTQEQTYAPRYRACEPGSNFERGQSHAYGRLCATAIARNLRPTPSAT